VSTYVAVFALVIAYAALIAAYCALRTLARLRRATVVLSRGARGERDKESLLEATTRHAELTASIADELRVLREYVDTSRQEDAVAQAEHLQGQAGALCHVSLVRYDAFADLSGRMSFSLALLDDHGDGVTISALAGRSDTRIYAKSIAAGQGEHELSPEELQAVQAALPKKGVLTRKIA
jgi:hypothetical protein